MGCKGVNWSHVAADGACYNGTELSGYMRGAICLGASNYQSVKKESVLQCANKFLARSD